MLRLMGLFAHVLRIYGEYGTVPNESHLFTLIYGGTRWTFTAHLSRDENRGIEHAPGIYASSIAVIVTLDQ